MHDPLTLAFEIKIPLLHRRKNRFLKSQPSEWQFYRLASIWHKDPERDSTDDSCGWFKRSRHGSPEVLEKIVKRFTEDWDRTWTYDPAEDGGDESEQKEGKKTYPCGYFNPSGVPRFSVTGILLNLIFLTVCEHFKSDGRDNWKKAKAFMRKNLFDIMFFAENPTDSMFDSFTLKYGKDTRREDRIRATAEILYGWVLRADQRWWQHPRWHIHHWRVQVHLWQSFYRWAFERCSKCGKRFRWNESVIGDWNGTRIWHDRCEHDRSNEIIRNR